MDTVKQKGNFVGLTLSQQQEDFLKKVAKHNGLKLQEIIRRMVDEKRLGKELIVW